jgi:transcription termination/antitermination protein NusG
MAWYTIQTRPNYENKVVEQILAKIKENNVSEVREVFSPEEIIIDYQNGQKKEKKKKLYTNYIFVEMDYTDEIWHRLKGTSGIKGLVGFVGSQSNPTRLPDSEILTMKARIAQTAPKPKVTFDVDARIKIIDGNFADFYGIIKEVNYEKNKAKILLNIFGRETTVELELATIELAQ